MRHFGRFTLLFAVVGIVGATGFTLGRRAEDRAERHQMAEQAARLDALQREVALLMQHRSATGTVTGTVGVTPQAFDASGQVQSSLVEAVASRVRRDLGLMSPVMVRDLRQSFVELYTNDSAGVSSYGTAGHLGNGYFITVKHGVMTLGGDAGAAHRQIVSVRLRIGKRLVAAEVVDAGDANAEVEPGDWAILRVRQPVSLPALRVNLGYSYPFADPIVRLGNDYSKGIIAATGYVGEMAGGLVTCLTDGHPGVSGGGVLNQDGQLVGIPVGRMQGDYRFSFILPLRDEMFRKVPGLPTAAPAEVKAN
jgi:Trypsin-like peptidase domain